MSCVSHVNRLIENEATTGRERETQLKGMENDIKSWRILKNRKNRGNFL